MCVYENRLPRIYIQLRQTLNMSDASKDLKWWSQNHGVDMQILWPTFEVIILFLVVLAVWLCVHFDCYTCLALGCTQSENTSVIMNLSSLVFHVVTVLCS